MRLKGVLTEDECSLVEEEHGGISQGRDFRMSEETGT